MTASFPTDSAIWSVDNRRIEGAGTSAEEWNSCGKLANVPSTTLQNLIFPGKRIIIVAPHPDDEILGCGGLMQMLKPEEIPLVLVAVTDGDASHPGSILWPPPRLTQERPMETLRAMAALQVFPDIHRLALPDGQVVNFQSSLQADLEKLLRPDDVVLSTWRFDGHPDHEATGRASAAAVAAKGARLIEVPIWAWHWAVPGDACFPWQRSRKFLLDPDTLEAKRIAVACYRSQLEYDASTGKQPILPPAALARLLRPYEIYFI